GTLGASLNYTLAYTGSSLSVTPRALSFVPSGRIAFSRVVDDFIFIRQASRQELVCAVSGDGIESPADGRHCRFGGVRTAAKTAKRLRSIASSRSTENQGIDLFLQK
ncbi:MAG: hypothetical protein K2Y20_13110, partial [Sphingomonas sp.]|nr:hypothetical protein [Sphingomonas sp.]